MPKHITPTQKKKLVKLVKAGFTIKDAAIEAGMGYSSARTHISGLSNLSGDKVRQEREESNLAAPIPLDQLSTEAERAYNDIEYFALRYFGIKLAPFQVIAANRIVQLYHTPEEEYVIINVAPGTGKTTFFTYILPAWLTVRDRTIRGLLGSTTDRLAERYTIRLRDIFQQTFPIQASSKDRKSGLAVDAEACLIDDYGRFKPVEGSGTSNIWRAASFKVEFPEGVSTGEKEPTWSAYGQGARFIGTRCNVCMWDDAYDKNNNKTEEAREENETWWDDYAESRLEPGGILILQGQRLDIHDLYAYNKKKTIIIDEDGKEQLQNQYHQIIFPAHFDELCEGNHGDTANPPPAYPDGCLLFPQRLPWRKLERKKQTNPQSYEVVYQQKDQDPGSKLVLDIWVEGGRDVVSGEMFPGCKNPDRGLELPKGLRGTAFSYMTVDPSSSKFWSIQWMLYHVPTETRYLINHIRKRLKAGQFLGYNPSTHEYTGVAVELVAESRKKRYPIRFMIVEQNAAQRYLLQYEHVKVWARKNRVRIIGHETHTNKADSDFGVEALIPDPYRYGLIDLPTKTALARKATNDLLGDISTWPSGAQDATMSQWFGEHRLPYMQRQLVRDQSNQKTLWQPSWAKEGAPV